MPLIILAGVILVILIILSTMVPVGLWITAFFSGVKIGLPTLIGMRLRRVDRKSVV